MMSNILDNNAKWQNEYWKRLSHQRSIEHPFNASCETNGGAKYDSTFSDKNESRNNLSHYRLSFVEENQEYLNPRTKNWRESLRAWSIKHSEYGNSPRNPNKISNKQWLEQERRKTSQKMDVVQFMSKK